MPLRKDAKLTYWFVAVCLVAMALLIWIDPAVLTCAIAGYK